MIYILCKELYLSENPYCACFKYFVLIDKMKRLSQSGSSNFCPELRKNALLISQSYFSNFALHMIMFDSNIFRTKAWFTLVVRIGDDYFWAMLSSECCIYYCIPLEKQCNIRSILWFVRHSFTYVRGRNSPILKCEPGLIF